MLAAVTTTVRHNSDYDSAYTGIGPNTLQAVRPGRGPVEAAAATYRFDCYARDAISCRRLTPTKPVPPPHRTETATSVIVSTPPQSPNIVHYIYYIIYLRIMYIV